MWWARLRGRLFRARTQRKMSYRAVCVDCLMKRGMEHRPCFHPRCHCPCSRFHGGRKLKNFDGWEQLLAKPGK